MKLYDWGDYAGNMSTDEHTDDCEWLAGSVVICKCPPKRSQCTECNLFTLLTYRDGRAQCQNFACELHVPRDPRTP